MLDTIQQPETAIEDVFDETIRHVNARQHPGTIALLRVCQHFMPNTPRDESLRCASGEFLPAAASFTSLRILKSILGDCTALSEAAHALREEINK